MRFLLLAVALTLIAAYPAGADAEGAPPAYPLATPYVTIRSELISRGYTPVHVPNQDAEDCQEHQVECRRYPELWRCNYSIATPCDYVWRAPDGALILMTAGVGQTEHDIWLDNKIRFATAEERKAMFVPQRSPFPKFKRHTPYAEVRKELLAHGYKALRLPEPLSPECTPYADRCTLYPELATCSGTGAGYCQVGWRAPNGRIVIVETVAMADPIGFYWIEFADRGEIRTLRRQMVERQTYRPFD